MNKFDGELGRVREGAFLENAKEFSEMCVRGS